MFIFDFQTFLFNNTRPPPLLVTKIYPSAPGHYESESSSYSVLKYEKCITINNLNKSSFVNFKIYLYRLGKENCTGTTRGVQTGSTDKCTDPTSVEWLARVTVLSRGVACPVSRRKRSALETDTGQFNNITLSYK